MKPILIVKLGSTFPSISARHGDSEDWFSSRMKVEEDIILVTSPVTGDPLPSLTDISGAVVTGSYSMVTDGEAWTKPVAEWLRDAVVQSVPIFAVCFAHHLLAEAMGGSVDYNPLGREIGTVTVTRTANAEDDILFRDLPPKFPAHVVHAQTVMSLPPEATLLAKSDLDSHQAFVVNDCAWGIQFHPEFDEEIMRACIMEDEEALIADGHDIDELLSTIRPTPESSSLLERFAKLALKRQRS